MGKYRCVGKRHGKKGTDRYWELEGQMQGIEEDTVAEAEILPKAALLHDCKLIQEPHPLITPFL